VLFFYWEGYIKNLKISSFWWLINNFKMKRISQKKRVLTLVQEKWLISLNLLTNFSLQTKLWEFGGPRLAEVTEICFLLFESRYLCNFWSLHHPLCCGLVRFLVLVFGLVDWFRESKLQFLSLLSLSGCIRLVWSPCRVCTAAFALQSQGHKGTRPLYFVSVLIFAFLD